MLEQILKIILMNKNITLLLFFILSLTANSLSVLSENSELKISSNELKIDSKGRNSIFIGNVYVEDNNLKVWSNKTTINFDEDKSNCNRNFCGIFSTII